MFTVEDVFPPSPECFGAKCEVCGVGDREGVRVVRESNVDIDHGDAIYTALFVCEWCVWEWAQALGMVTIAEADLMRAALDEQAAAIGTLASELERLRPVREAIEAFAPQVREAEAKEAAKEACPECDKPVSRQGMNLHRRQAHGVGKA